MDRRSVSSGWTCPQGGTECGPIVVAAPPKTPWEPGGQSQAGPGVRNGSISQGLTMGSGGWNHTCPERGIRSCSARQPA